MNLSFKALKRNLKKDFTGLKKIKVAVLGDSATQMYVQALRGYGFEKQLNIDIYEADYNQVDLQVFGNESELYDFNPDYVIIFFNTKSLYKRFGKLDNRTKINFAKTELDHFANIYRKIKSRIVSKIILLNFNEIDDTVFGNYGNKTQVSFLYQLRKINFELMNLSQELKDLFILDLQSLQNQYGYEGIHNSKIYVNTELYFDIDFLPVIAKNTIDIILSVEGIFKKCLILDLDNTVWGGIVGDDGIENIQVGDLGIGKVFTELQIWAKQLKQRGIILAVCSKNDEKNAKEPFEKHPEMVLRLEDISVFVANWNNKADNIKYIQRILNIGFDSMVFLDDNPFERNMVRTHVQDVCVPELPEDPAEYLNYLRTLNLFETATFSEEDEKRTEKYQVQAKRMIAQEQFTDETDFLKSLEMIATVEIFNKFNTPRVSQLTQRSNQFNLRTKRYTEEEIENFSKDKNHINLAVRLADKFGDYGLISVVILNLLDANTAFIDTWIMSCRVLKRDVEKFVLNQIVKKSKELGIKEIIGEYLPTPKNGMVKDHYKNLGFYQKDEKWVLNVDKYKNLTTYIKTK